MLQPSLKPVLVGNLYRHQVLGSNANSSIPCKLQTVVSCLNLLLLRSLPGQHRWTQAQENRPAPSLLLLPISSSCLSTPPAWARKAPFAMVVELFSLWLICCAKAGKGRRYLVTRIIYSGLCYPLACKPVSLCRELHWMGQVWTSWWMVLLALAAGPWAGLPVPGCEGRGESACARGPRQRDSGCLALPSLGGKVCNACAAVAGRVSSSWALYLPRLLVYLGWLIC